MGIRENTKGMPYIYAMRKDLTSVMLKLAVMNAKLDTLPRFVVAIGADLKLDIVGMSYMRWGGKVLTIKPYMFATNMGKTFLRSPHVKKNASQSRLLIVPARWTECIAGMIFIPWDGFT